MNEFNRDYYEEGVAKGISGYTNYHYRPEYVFPLAQKIKSTFEYIPAYGLGTLKVLDYGCAKGYLVKALRLLDVDAYGFDISEYAVQNGDPSVKVYLSNNMSDFNSKYFHVSIAKDTLEHVPKDQLQGVLAELKRVTEDTLIVIVPLGDNGLFRIREFELDKTHVIKEDEEFWIKEFKKAGYSIKEFHYEYGNSKDHWLKVNPYGNGIFILEVHNDI